MSSLTLTVIIISYCSCFLVICSTASSLGLFLLYRPRDVTNDCVISHHLRFDISFGMGMSDTISMVLRTQAELDYQCTIEIVTDEDMYLLVVIRFPNDMGTNCDLNRNAISVLRTQAELDYQCTIEIVTDEDMYLLVVIRFPNDMGTNCDLNRNAISVYNSASTCESVCHIIGHKNIMSPYFLMTIKTQVKLHFLSNSSINAELNATMYQISATAARKAPARGCSQENETLCNTMDDSFCFTSFVMCDGIKNCGVQDWFDERKSDCGLPVQKLSYSPVVAVVAAVFCALMVAGHFMSRCLPPLANSFFIFNTNEDNRLRIDPILIPPEEGPAEEILVKRTSLIPVSSSSSVVDDENTTEQVTNISGDNVPAKVKTSLPAEPGSTDDSNATTGQMTVKKVSAKIQDKLRNFIK